MAGALGAQDPLAQFNALFRESYAAAKAASLAGPVLLVDGDRLRLYRNNAPVAERLIRPARYHRLKAVAHVPLALQVLSTAPAGPAAERLERLRTMGELARAARVELASWCDGPVLDRQRRILDTSLEWLDALLGPEALDGRRMAGFAGTLGPLLLANAADAAALELEALDQAARAFRAGMAAADWRVVQVVIIGSHMAREGEVTQQYFARLLGEPGEGGRIIYAEGLWRPGEAMDLLATHRVDQAAGAAFFGDPMRMHRDILAGGARQWLDAHAPASAATPMGRTVD
jgi:hypothetical protein